MGGWLMKGIWGFGLVFILSLTNFAHAEHSSGIAGGRPSAAPTKQSDQYYRIQDWILGLAESTLNGGGSGIYASANAGIGGGAFLEAVSFKDEGTNFYCGPTVSTVSDAQVSAGGYVVKALNCDKEKYKGGFLTVGLSVQTPGLELSGNMNVSLGVDNANMARALGDAARTYERMGPAMVARALEILGQWTKGQGQLATAMKDPSPAQKAMLAVVAELVKNIGSLSNASVGGVQEAADGLRRFVQRDFDQFMKDPSKADLRVSPKTLMDELTKGFQKVAASPAASADDKQMARLMADLLGQVGGTLTGCDSVAGGASLGVGFLPVTAGLSYSNYAHLGAVGEGVTRALRTNGKSVAQLLSTLRRETGRAGDEAPSFLESVQAGFLAATAMPFIGAQAGFDLATSLSSEDLRTLGNVLYAGTAPGFASLCLAPALEPIGQLAQELGNTQTAQRLRRLAGL